MQNILSRIEHYLKQYVSFADDRIALVLACWACATHAFGEPVNEKGSDPLFDAFPYLVITSATKRSGKTRLAELIGFLSANPKNFAAMTASTMFRIIDDRENGSPTIFFDEAETLSSEAASAMRAVLNVGYRKGQKIPRTSGQGVREFSTYCPKVFILIGDVYDTLRDRSIVIMMRRGNPAKRFSFEEARIDAAELREVAVNELSCDRVKLEEAYRFAEANYLSDRDAEIWLSVLAVCKTLAPERVAELQRIAVDLSAEKTAPTREFKELAEFETAAENDEYSRRLLADVSKAMDGNSKMFSTDIVEKLKTFDLSPWRKFRGTGLNPEMLADMLSKFGVRPKTVRIGKKTLKGYDKLRVQQAVKLHLEGGL